MRFEPLDPASKHRASSSFVVKEILEIGAAESSRPIDATDVVRRLKAAVDQADVIEELGTQFATQRRNGWSRAGDFLARLDNAVCDTPEGLKLPLAIFATVAKNRDFAEGIAHATLSALQDGQRGGSLFFRGLLLAMASDQNLAGRAMSPLCHAARKLDDPGCKEVLQKALEADGWFFASRALDVALHQPVVVGLALERVREPNTEIASRITRLLDAGGDPFEERLRMALAQAVRPGQSVALSVRATLSCISFERRVAQLTDDSELGVEAVAGAIHYLAATGKNVLHGGTAPNESMQRVARRVVDRFPTEALEIAKSFCPQHWGVEPVARLVYLTHLPGKALFKFVSDSLPPGLSGDRPSDIQINFLREKVQEVIGAQRWQELCLEALSTRPLTLEKLAQVEAAQTRLQARRLLALDNAERAFAALIALAQSPHDDNRAALLGMLRDPPNLIVFDVRSKIIRWVLEENSAKDLFLGCVSVIPQLPDKNDFKIVLKNLSRAHGLEERRTVRAALRLMKEWKVWPF